MAPGRDTRWAAAVLALAALAAGAAAQVVLNDARCAQAGTLPQLQTPEETQVACSLCQNMYRNRVKWNWRAHPDSVLAGLPTALRTLGLQLACKLRQCSAFSEAVCEAPLGARAMPEGPTPFALSPCPSKFVCYSCLSDLFSAHNAGCLDGLYDRI